MLPDAFPVAVAPSIDEPVELFEAVQVTPPFASPLRVAVAGALGGDDQLTASVRMVPLTVALNAPQSAIWGGGGVLFGHPVKNNKLVMAPASTASLFMRSLRASKRQIAAKAVRQSHATTRKAIPIQRSEQTYFPPCVIRR